MSSGGISRLDPKASRAKRARNKNHSLQLLSDLGVPFEQKSEHHFVISWRDKTADFWPTTGQWRIRPSTQYFRGVFHLLRDLGVGRGVAR